MPLTQTAAANEQRREDKDSDARGQFGGGRDLVRLRAAHLGDIQPRARKGGRAATPRRCEARGGPCRRFYKVARRALARLSNARAGIEYANRRAAYHGRRDGKGLYAEPRCGQCADEGL